jgi:hypothetical protein
LPLKFNKRSQLFIRTHNETLSVALSLNNEDIAPSESMLTIQPQSQRSLLRFVAIISQSFTLGIYGI